MHTELTREQFVEEFQQLLESGRQNSSISNSMFEFVSEVLYSNNLEHAYDMYLYCLDVFKGIRIGKEAKVSVEILSNKGTKYVITNTAVCINLKNKYKTYYKFYSKFNEDMNVFHNLLKLIPEYTLTLTAEELLKMGDKKKRILKSELALSIKAFSLCLAVPVFLEDIWEHIPTV